MPNRTRKLHTLLAMCAFVAIAACAPAPDHEMDIDDWPTGLVTPIEGATFSLDKVHLPGDQSHSNVLASGFVFTNGSSGRPLGGGEPVRSLSDGQIVRIDRQYEPPESETLEFWRQSAAEAGPVADYAHDQLRGRQIWIRHDDGHISRYAHLSEVHPELQPGDSVEQGEVIGLMGNSGIPATDDQPEPAPRLYFELWTAEGSRFLGQDLSPLEIHRAVAALFSEDALPRYARQVVSQVNSGESPPEIYPPEELPEVEFMVDPPVSVAAGNAFAIPVTWTGDEFRASDFFATLADFPLGILDAGEDTGLTWLLGAMPLDAAGKDAVLVVNAFDRFGRTLTGSSTIRADSKVDAPQPQEVSQAQFEQYSEQNRQTEANALGPALLRSLEMSQPMWQQPFQPPLEGEVTGPFGEKIFFGILRPTHPRPGTEIRPDEAGTDVLAVNDGIVALTRDLPIRGTTVAIIHGSGVVSVYGGLGEITVTEGDSVAQSQRLGTMPANEGSEAATLQWEMYIAGTPTNPLPWIGNMLPER